MSTAASYEGNSSRTEFIVLVSCIMMTVAFAIDSMLPALPAIGTELGVAEANDRPIVITAFVVGFTIALALAGILSDTIGRRKPLLLGMIGYVVASFLCSMATSFEMLLAARLVQGFAAGVSQVVIRSIVRDRFSGRDMAQVMSLASMVFMMAPILAPKMGQLVLKIAPWQGIFISLAIIGLIVLIWSHLRVAESLPPGKRARLDGRTLKANARIVVTDRLSLGYTLANALMSSVIFSFLLSVQQIFEQTFQRADFLPTGFAIMSLGMAGASLLNAAIVKRYGMQVIGHTALLFFIVLAAIHLFVSLFGYETLWLFTALQGIMMIAYALCMGNFNTVAMENMGSVAGMANSIQGLVSNVIGLGLGSLIGQSFDGTTAPFYAGCVAVGLLSIVIIWQIERGRLFTAHSLHTKE